MIFKLIIFASYLCTRLTFFLAIGKQFFVEWSYVGDSENINKKDFAKPMTLEQSASCDFNVTKISFGEDAHDIDFESSCEKI